MYENKHKQTNVNQISWQHLHDKNKLINECVDSVIGDDEGGRDEDREDESRDNINNDNDDDYSDNSGDDDDRSDEEEAVTGGVIDRH